MSIKGRVFVVGQKDLPKIMADPELRKHPLFRSAVSSYAAYRSGRGGCKSCSKKRNSLTSLTLTMAALRRLATSERKLLAERFFHIFGVPAETIELHVQGQVIRL